MTKYTLHPDIVRSKNPVMVMPVPMVKDGLFQRLPRVIKGGKPLTKTYPAIKDQPARTEEIPVITDDEIDFLFSDKCPSKGNWSRIFLKKDQPQSQKATTKGSGKDDK